MFDYYHASNDLLEIGTRLAPMYGKKIHNEDYFRFNDLNYSQYIRECIFEDIRSQYFPNTPSRLKSIFLVENYEHALEYAKRFHMRFVYGVSLQSSGRIHFADMSWMDLSVRSPFEKLKEIAHCYYSGSYSANPFEEVLYEGSVIVEDLVEQLVTEESK